MKISSAEEVRERYIKEMGRPLGEVFHLLWQELSDLNFKWREYVELYGTKPSRIALLNKAAPYFFRVVEDVLWESTLMRLCRLTDPPNTRKSENLSVARLPSLVKVELAEEIQKLVQVATGKTEFCRDWRNRHIAHADLPLALGEGAEPLKSASRADVVNALSALADILNAVDFNYTGASAGFDLGATTDGAESLLSVLDEGVRALERREERLQAGKLLPEDEIDRDL